MSWIYKVLRNYLRPKNAIDFNTLDFTYLSFDQLNKILINQAAEITYQNDVIIAEWESTSQLLKIEYTIDGKFQRLIHLKYK